MEKKRYDNCSSICLDSLEKKIRECKGDLAAIFFEPVAGEGGYIVPPKEFVTGLSKLCNKYNILLVSDEVQAGCYRTGTFLAIENFGVKADIICLGKSIGGGIPFGATVSDRKIMDWPSGSHANTFGGNLLACAAGTAVLKFMKENKLGDNARKVGSYMLKRLNEMKEKYEIIGDVRGLGLMIGVEIVENKKTKKFNVKERDAILCDCQGKGLVMLPAGINTIRILPPLVINREEAELGLDILEESIKELKKEV